MDFEQKYQKDPGMNRVNHALLYFTLTLVEHLIFINSSRSDAHLPPEPWVVWEANLVFLERRGCILYFLFGEAFMFFHYIFSKNR